MPGACIGWPDVNKLAIIAGLALVLAILRRQARSAPDDVVVFDARYDNLDPCGSESGALPDDYQGVCW